ncbi:MAG: hypothetical protein U1F16_03615 [Turneriella sp.]
MSSNKVLRCQCHHDIKSASVFARGVYRPHDRFLLSLGATRRPIRVEIRCTRCGDLFAISTDRALRERTCARDWVSADDLRLIEQATWAA